SSDVDGVVGDAIVTYEWDLNNDSVIDVTGVNPTVTTATLAALGLVAADDYTVKLRVTDSYGKFDEDTVVLTVTEPTVNASVVGRHLFYNNSKWDNAAQGFDDHDAIAPDKE